jgi:purine nucleoside phosphorylase
MTTDQEKTNNPVEEAISSRRSIRALVARHCGMQVAAVAVITNYAAGMQSGLSHEQTLASGKEAAPRLKKLLLALLERI